MEIPALDENLAQKLDTIISKNEGVESIETLLKESTSDDQRSLILDTSLLLAVQCGREPLVATLLEKGANPNRQHRKGRRGVTFPLLATFTSAQSPPRLSIVKLLLNHGADPNLQDENGNWPVGAATLRGFDSFVEAFLQSNRADLTRINAQGNNLLHMAVSRPGSAQEDRSGLIDMLMKHGIDAAAENSQGDTPFLKAVRQGSIDSVKAILKHVSENADKANSILLSRNKKGLTALHEAAIWGHAAVIEALLESKIFDVNVLDDEQNTALILAGDRKRVGAIVSSDPLHAVKSLLSHGASVRVQNKNGETALHLPDCSIEYLELVLAGVSPSDSDLLTLKDSRGRTAILGHLVDQRPYHAQALLLFVDKSLIPSPSSWMALSPDYSCLLPLVSIDAAECIRLLLGTESTVLPENVASQFMQTAIRHSALNVICYLCKEQKVSISSSAIELCREPSEDGQTILHVAATRNHREAVRLLVEAGMDVNVDNLLLDEFSDGGQPLHNASIAGAIEAAGELIELGADVNSQSNPRQETPLLLACRFNHLQMVKLLLDKGADISLPDVDGNSALDEASMRPETEMEMIHLLQEHLKINT